MKHYIDKSGAIFAFEDDGSQDHLVTDDMSPISHEEVFQLTKKEQTKEEWRESAAITSRQGEQQLILSGLDEQVEAAIDSIEDATERKLTRAWYQRATVWERNNPQLIALGEALGLTDEQIDDLFKQASEL